MGGLQLVTKLPLHGVLAYAETAEIMSAHLGDTIQALDCALLGCRSASALASWTPAICQFCEVVFWPGQQAQHCWLYQYQQGSKAKERNHVQASSIISRAMLSSLAAGAAGACLKKLERP